MASKKSAKKGGSQKSSAKKTGSLKAGAPLISERTLKSLLSECNLKAVKIGSINGELREKIAYAVEHHHLNNKAFAETRKIAKMVEKNPAIAHDYVTTVMAYCDMTGLTAKMLSAPRLPLEDADKEKPAATKKGNGADKGDEPNVVRPRQFGQRGAADDANTLTGAQTQTESPPAVPAEAS
jgi:hypothetical protein